MASFYRSVALLLLLLTGLAAGLNNLNQQHGSKLCSEHASDEECLKYAACQVDGDGNCTS